MKKRVLNIRVMFAVFCGLMVGILFPYLIILNKLSFTLGIIFGFLILLICVGFIGYSFYIKKKDENIACRKNVSGLIKISSMGFLVAFLVGIFLILYPIINCYSIYDFEKNVVVTGSVSTYVQSDNYNKKFLMDNCVVEIDAQKFEIDFMIYVSAISGADISLGETLKFECKLDKYDFDKSSDRSKLLQSIGYHTFVTNIEKIGTNVSSIRNDIHNATKDALLENLNSDNANITFAMLFGGKQGLSDDLKDMFSYSGISHILAVSGLHIGVLVSLIYFFLKKIKCNKFIKLICLAVILIFYSYLCDFTPSVCRASIMAIILCLCDLYKIQYDALSSLSVAGIIILIFDPSALFLVSFQLSFLCVFAIITVAPTLLNVFGKLRFPNWLAQTLAFSIATNIVILPIMCNSFIEISLLGIISNIFVLPIFSIAYVLFFVIMIFALIFKTFGMLLCIPNLFLHLIKVIAEFVSGLDFGIYKVFTLSYSVLVLLVILAIIVQFLMIKKYYKAIFASVLMVIITAISIVNMIPNYYSKSNLIFTFKYDSNICYFVNENSVTLIGSNIESKTILNDLKKLKINKITNIIAYDLQLNDLENLQKIMKDNYCENIYVPSKFNYPGLIDKIGEIKFFDGRINIIDGMSLDLINYDEQIIAVYLKTSFGNLLIPEIKPTKAEAAYLCDKFKDVDYVYINESNKIDLQTLNAQYIISNEKLNIDNDYTCLKIKDFIILSE